MKRLILTLIILLSFACGLNAQQQEMIFIPLAQEMNNDIPSHLLPDTATPYASNVLFENGEIKKRYGITTITTTAGAIKGYFDATDDYALVMAHNGQTWGETPPPGVIAYEWNRDVSVTYSPSSFVRLNDTHLDTRQTPTYFGGFAAKGGGNPDLTPALFSPTETFSFTNHHDPVVGTVSIFTNGADVLHKYIHANQTYTDIYTAGEERKIDFLQDPTQITQTWVKGKFLQSFYDSVYLSNITSDGYKADGVTKVTNITETGIVDPFETFWSDQLDATDYGVTQNHQPRTEGGTPITGLKVFKDILFLLKKDQVWAITPYDNFERISQVIGSVNNEGTVAANLLYLNDRGRIVDINNTFISKKIHKTLASRDPGTWDIRAIYNNYNDEILFSASNYIFKYKIFTQTWETYKYEDKIQLLSVIAPGKPFNSWIGALNKHSVLSINEEDIIADFVAIYGAAGNKLVAMNHFAEDDEKAIEVVYETRQEAAGDTTNKKRWQMVTLQGQLDPTTAYATRATVTVYGWFGNSPVTRPAWRELGTVKFDDNGYGELFIKEGEKIVSGSTTTYTNSRSIWTAFKFVENSTKALKISKIGVKFVNTKSSQ